MPMLYSLGQHGALESIQDSLLDDEHLFAYLDDLYVVCSPERVAAIFKIIDEALEAYARIQVHLGKTQVWNRGGQCPPGCDNLQNEAEEGPSAEQGIRVLGIPIGHVDFVEAQVRREAPSSVRTDLASAGPSECVALAPLLCELTSHVFPAGHPTCRDGSVRKGT